MGREYLFSFCLRRLGFNFNYNKKKIFLILPVIVLYLKFSFLWGNLLRFEHVDWNAKQDVAVVGDVTCKKLTTEDRSQYHCEIENGPKFLIRNHTGHKTLSFAVTDTTNLSEKTRGVIGRFVKPDGYAVIPNDENTAAVISDGVQYNATKHHFHHQEQCWTLKTPMSKKCLNKLFITQKDTILKPTKLSFTLFV